MSNSISLRVNLFWRIGLAGFVLCAVPPCLWTQGASLPQQTPSYKVQPFAALDDSVSRTADTLFVSATQAITPAKVEARAAILAINDDQPSRLSDNDRQSAATTRMNLLRPVVEPILKSHGVPADLAAVIFVESAGRATALSPKGARGLWQLMPSTARRYGLRVEETHDDRLDLFRSTDAAAQYLHDLYAQFGDWKLALAAYNTGEANVGSAILKAHTQDFDQLTNLRLLPLETRNYVPRVLATAQLIGQSSTLVEIRRPASATTVFAVTIP